MVWAGGTAYKQHDPGAAALMKTPHFPRTGTGKNEIPKQVL